MLTLIITRLADRDRHDDGPYLAFATVLLDLAVALAFATMLDLKVGGIALALHVLAWGLALTLSNTSKRAHAHHLTRKASR